MALPRFFILQSNDKNDSLGYINEKASYGYLSFMQTQDVNPFAKFEVENATTDGFVHIRSCLNNKYWVRTKDTCAENYWITATADKREEDRTKETCTLFRTVPVDPSANTVRFMHAQSECFLYAWPWKTARCVLANFKAYDANSRDVFTVIDWSSLLVLPRYIAFKGENNQYLRLHNTNNQPFVQFVTGDIGDPAVSFETFVTHDGSVRFKSMTTNNFWKREPHQSSWIIANSNDNSNNNKDTLFRPVKVDDTTIGLLNVGNNQFCRLLNHGVANGFIADTPYVNRPVRVIVEEPILSRVISNARYSLANSRIYDERVLVLASNVASNYSQQPATLDMKLSYRETKTSTWNTMYSLKLPLKATIDFEVPVIIGGRVQLSGEIQRIAEWGETKTATTVVEVVNKVVVPPMTKVTVDLVATNGKCDVPFTFTQSDTFYNGRVVTTEVQGGVYTGLNYYNIDFQTKQESLANATVENMAKTPVEN